jgi:hypothetical protein
VLSWGLFPGYERIGADVPELDRLVDEVVDLGGLLGAGVDGMLGDSSPNQESLEIASTSVASSTSPEAANLIVPSDATK